MADNFSFTEGSGKTGAADEIGGVLYPRVKIAQGADGVATDVSSAAPLQVTLANTGANSTAVKVDGSAAPQPVTDNGGSLTVDGTVAVTDGGGTISIDDGGGSVTVDGTVAVTGVATLTEQQTQTAHLATIAGDTTDIEAAVELLDDTVFAEDSAATAGDKGLAVLAVRRDANTSMVGADNDYANLQVDATGSLKVAIISGAGSGGTAIQDGAVFTPDTTNLTPIGGYRDDTSPATVTEGDAAAARITANRAIHVNLRDASGNELSVGGGTQYTEDAAAAADPVGTVQMLVRADTPAAVTSTDGDNIATRGTNKGEVYVKHIDAIPVTDNAGSLTVDNAGTFVTQENGAALTALQLIDDTVATLGTTTYTEATTKANVIGAVRRDADTTLVDTTNEIAPLQVNAGGQLKTAVVAALPTGSNTIGAVNIAAAQTLATVTTVGTVSSITAVGTVTPGTAAANLGKAEDAAHASGDTGVMSLAVRSDTLAASSGTTGDYEPLHTDSVGAMWTRASSELADDAAFTPGTSRVMPVGMQADETSTDSVDEGDIGAPRITLDRKQIITEQPHTAGGLSMSKTVSAASTNATNVKNAAGKIYAIQASNVNAAARYLKLYNKASAPTVGTDVPVKTLIIPGNTAGAGTNIVFPTGIEFTTGISFALTTGIADSDTGAVAASELGVNIDYK